MGHNSSAVTEQTSVESSRSEPAVRTLLLGNYHGRFGAPGVVEQVAARLRAAGVPVLGASSYRSGLARAAHMMWTVWARRDDYDVASVDLFSGRAFRWGETAARVLHRLNKPFAFVLHGGGLPEFAAANPTRVRRTLALASRVLAPSPFLQRQMGAYRHDVELLPNALDIAHYPFRLRSPAAPRLIWLRAFHDIYDAPLAVRVLARLRSWAANDNDATLAQATLTMIGPDKGDGSRARAEACARELGVVDAVRFVGQIAKDEVPAALDQADVFLNTTTVDNTPVSVVEAMACGLCVVSTNVGGLPDLLSHEQEALLVPPGEVDEMARAVRHVIRDANLAGRLSQQGRARAERHSWEHVLPQWMRLVAELHATAKAPSQ